MWSVFAFLVSREVMESDTLAGHQSRQVDYLSSFRDRLHDLPKPASLFIPPPPPTSPTHTHTHICLLFCTCIAIWLTCILLLPPPTPHYIFATWLANILMILPKQKKIKDFFIFFKKQQQQQKRALEHFPLRNQNKQWTRSVGYSPWSGNYVAGGEGVYYLCRKADG